MNQNHPPNDPSFDEGVMRQDLLELHYGLLDGDEAETLQRQIASDPRIAKLWAETLVVADKFALAARIDSQTHRAFERPQAMGGNAPATPSNPSITPPTRFLKVWLASLATAATLAIAIAGVRHWNRMPVDPPAGYRVAVEPIDGVGAKARNEFWVSVRQGEGRPAGGAALDRSLPIVPATISFQVLSKGVVLFLGKAETADSGPVRIRVPDDVVIPSGAVLRVDATPLRGDANSIRLSVPLEPTRCLTYLTTDRPVYRPGETVFFRSVTLNRRTFAAHLEVPIRYELIDPSGTAVPSAAIEGVSERGVGNGAFVIPESTPGGSYQLVAKSLDGFFPEQQCDIEVRHYRAVRLKTDLQFAKRSFGPGDRVEAELIVRRADDQIPAFAATRVQATVDGDVVYQSSTTLNESGELSVAFDLPDVLRDGQGTLSIAIDDGSVTETASRPIPIFTGRVEVDFYPEGGYLVGGIDNRVYFSSRDRDGNPIEVAGEILSQAGRVVAEVQTVRDGMGRFEFKPEAGQRYSMRVTSPLDVTETPWLPSVVEALPVMHTGGSVFESGEPIRLTLRSTKRRQCLIRAVCRGELIGVQAMELSIGDNAIRLPVQDRAAGVIRLTVLDAQGPTAQPLVERLVYRRGHRALNIRTSVDDGSSIRSPGDSVRMTIAVTDASDKPVPGAVLGVRVVDDAALSLRQKENPTLKTHFLLTSEVQSPEDLEHANVYLTDDPEAAESLDLLLGTQGWRRFVSGSPDKFDESFRDSLVRLLELDGPREGLITPAKSNDALVAEQYRRYRRHIAELWQRFLIEVRWMLIVIGGLWLIAFLFRPRRSGMVTARLILMAAGLFIQPGCGGQHQASVGSQAADEAFESVQSTAPPASAPTGPEELPEAGIIPADVANGTDGGGFGASGPPPDDSQEQSAGFARRVVDIVLGRGGRRTDIAEKSLRLSPEQLEQWQNARRIDAETIADQLMEQLRFPIRQYAHIHRNTDGGVREDFTETLLWNPMMVTDSSGTVSIRFDLSDSLTLFRVQVDGHTNDGRLGSGGGSVITRVPLEVDAKLPLEVSGGDRMDLPVGLVNATDVAQAVDVSVATDEGLRWANPGGKVSLPPTGRVSKMFSVEVAEQSQPRDAMIRIAGTSAEGHSDGTERRIRIVPNGFPFDVNTSGTLNGKETVSLEVPANLVAGSTRGMLKLYPSTRSQLSAGLESILREPHGCFEQASASNYPNVMTFQLMRLEGAVDDSMRKRTESLLRRGYRKLTAYECSQLGYEWFGNDPGHEALSAFGLMQFSEMASVIEIDQAMLQRTRQWLLSRRDGKGGFQRNPRHLHAWAVQQDIVNAYVLWALSQADRAAGRNDRTGDQLSQELDRMESVALQSEDAYLVALAAITLGNVGRTETMAVLLNRLTEWQNDEGSLIGRTTITQSGGLSLAVETTSLAVLAWSRSPAHTAAASRAVRWLIGNRQAGGFGSTQATILALKALIAVHDRMAMTQGGHVDVLLDGEVVTSMRWEGQPDECVSGELPADVIAALQNDQAARVTLRSEGSRVPYTVRLQGRTRTPSSDPSCPVKLRITLEKDQTFATVASGDPVDVVATISNAGATGCPMTVAAIGLPGGMEPVVEGLDELRKSGRIDYYELRGREVVLYWRTLAPDESKRVVVPCVAEVGGRYSGPPSHAYLYYTAESKTWHQPLVVEIR